MIKTGSEVATTIHPTEGLTRWSPFDEFSDLRHRMEELFSRAFGYTPLSNLIPNEPMTFEPVVDIYEVDSKLDLFVSLPGYKPEFIVVNATQGAVTIKGERKCLYDENAIARRQGWVAASNNFSVTYTLPCEIAPNMVKALFENGILHLEMPKSERAVTRSVKVKVQPV
jgi:HSP20 family protein